MGILEGSGRFFVPCVGRGAGTVSSSTRLPPADLCRYRSSIPPAQGRLCISHAKEATEMYAPSRITAISALLGIVVAAGCGDGATEPDLSFEPSEVRASVDALVSPMRQLVAPVSNLRQAFPTVVDRGLSYEMVAGDAALQLLAEPTASWQEVAGAVEIPAGLLGETFVLDQQQGAWVIDSTRTAPDSVVRVIWYTTDVNGTILPGAGEEGFIDLTDEDDGTGSLIGIHMVADTDTGTTVLADMTERQDTSTSGSTDVARFEATGFYNPGTVVEFEMSYELATESVAVDSQYAIDVDLVGDPGTLDWRISGAVDSTGAITQTVTSTMDSDGATTLTLDIAVDAAGTQTGNGMIARDGRDVVQVTIDGNSYSYTPVEGGGEFSTGQESELDGLVLALYLGGVEALTGVPLILLFD